MKKWKLLLLALLAGMALMFVACLGVFGPCWSAWFRWGVWVDRCPVGVMPVVAAQVSGVGRGVVGTVSVDVYGEIFEADLRRSRREPMSRVSLELAVVDAEGKAHEVEYKKGWSGSAWQHAEVILPEALPDGDYQLHVLADTPAGEASVDVALPLYKPALAHVLASAPLFRPGQVVRFRSVLLERASFAPVAQRPGRWILTDPSGEVLLDERGRSDDWGIAASDFPLADDAPAGSWKVEFRSGSASDSVSFEVREFQLPKAVPSAASARPWWSVGETPVIEGSLRYASGAPVAGASVRLRLSGGPSWEPPYEWSALEPTLTDEGGAWRLQLPPVPEDVDGVVKLGVRADFGLPTGESLSAGTTLVLAADPIAVDAVSELADGMVARAPNRVFVRVTTPDGRAVDAEKKLRLRPAWDEGAAWTEAAIDADGVARFLMNPGEPVTVVVPAPPVRPAPPPERRPVRIDGFDDRLDEDESLAERTAVERWLPGVAGCAAAGNGEDADVELTVAWKGGQRVLAHVSGSGAEATIRCVEAALGSLRPPTPDALWSIDLAFEDPKTPWLTATVEALAGAATPQLAGPLAEARSCARGFAEAGELPGALVWNIRPGARVAQASLLERPGADARAAAVLRCAAARLSSFPVDDSRDEARSGTLRLSVGVLDSAGVSQPAPTTWPGFEFVAEVEGLGRTRLRMKEGAIPPLRLRLDEVVVDPGTSVGLSAFRGPDFREKLPEKMELRQGDRVLSRFDVDPEKRSGTIDIPKDASGFASVEWGGARAVLYIRPSASLQVELSTSGGSWKPGSSVQLTARSSDQGKPVEAGLSLVGVDSTMAQLAPLPSPDDFSRVTVQAQMTTPAFGVLDAKALQSGLIAGSNAQQATVLRIGALPPASPAAESVSGSASGTVDVETPLTVAFYQLYREARGVVRAWEAEAPADQLLTNPRMAELWKQALGRAPAEDPFGRPLYLRNLPPDLLRLTDPRVMVDDATRLPEDIDDWATWVAKEQP